MWWTVWGNTLPLQSQSRDKEHLHSCRIPACTSSPQPPQWLQFAQVNQQESLHGLQVRIPPSLTRWISMWTWKAALFAQALSASDDMNTSLTVEFFGLLRAALSRPSMCLISLVSSLSSTMCIMHLFRHSVWSWTSEAFSSVNRQRRASAVLSEEDVAEMMSMKTTAASALRPASLGFSDRSESLSASFFIQSALWKVSLFPLIQTLLKALWRRRAAEHHDGSIHRHIGTAFKFPHVSLHVCLNALCLLLCEPILMCSRFLRSSATHSICTENVLWKTPETSPLPFEFFISAAFHREIFSFLLHHIQRILLWLQESKQTMVLKNLTHFHSSYAEDYCTKLAQCSDTYTDLPPHTLQKQFEASAGDVPLACRVKRTSAANMESRIINEETFLEEKWGDKCSISVWAACFLSAGSFSSLTCFLTGSTQPGWPQVSWRFNSNAALFQIWFLLQQKN